MRYSVILDSGEVFGPYEISELNQWIIENRILPTTILQPEGTSARLAASAVQGLEWQTGQTFEAFTEQKLNTTHTEIRGSWVCFVGSLILCCLPPGFHFLAGVVGIWLGYSAYRKSDSGGLPPLILNAILLLLVLVGLIFQGSFLNFKNLTSSPMIKQMIPGMKF